MIQIETSKTGLPIVKSGGRFLHSAYDPMSEAQAWLENIGDQVQDYHKIILLGIGSVYHCLSVQKKYPKKEILIVEVDANLSEQCVQLFYDLKTTKICHISNPRDLFKNSEILSFAEDVFCTLRLPSTRFVNNELFDDVEVALTGRSTYDFANICEARKNYGKQIEISKIGESSSVSVIDISRAFVQTVKKLSNERRVLYILEELIR